MRRPVGGHEVPPAVDDDRRERLVAGQDLVEGVAHRRHLGPARAASRGRAGRSRRREAARCARAAARRGARRGGAASSRLGCDRPGLDEAQVPGRHVGLEGQVELAEAPAVAPVLEQTRRRRGSAVMTRSRRRR